MILSFGQVYESNMQDEILQKLEDKINAVRMQPVLEHGIVISALDQISRRIKAGEFDNIISQLDMDGSAMYKEQAINLLSKESLEARLQTELGTITAPQSTLNARRVPLGTIFHIAAGNADVLPAYSLIEGLICGNINIMKLPEADNGLTIMLLKMLTDEEPALSGYIHVFDTPSSDIAAMQKMAQMADAISVWGGDSAISAVRQLSSPGCEIIEWGHKLSFCYISVNELQDHYEDLKGLARHIISTKQLLCSSCQVIFLNTEDMEELESFCRYFLPILENETGKIKYTDTGAAAEATLKSRCEEIDRILGSETPGKKRFSGKGCSLIACEDSELELSELWGNCLVKRLPQDKLMQVLRRRKGYLQTAGLIADENRDELTELLISCGINRILPAEEMSVTFPCESHDGKYPFQRYTRVVNYK